LTDLSVTPIAETIRRIWSERRSGDLLIRSKKATKMVFFEEGRIVFAASNVRKERLGDGLLAMGEISSDDHQRAAAMVGKGVRFGDALVSAGIMKRIELGASVARWMGNLVVSLFDLQAGSASFDDRPCAIPDEYKVNVSSAGILYRGARSMSHYAAVVAALGDLERFTLFAAQPDFLVEPEDQDILEQAAKAVRLRELVEASDVLESERVCAVYGLLAAGVLSGPYDHAPELPAAPVVKTVNTINASKAAKTSGPSALAALRTEIQNEMAQSETLDPTSWLGLADTADAAEILHALEERKARYDLLLLASTGDATQCTDVELLQSRVAMAMRLARRQEEAQKPQVSEAALLPEPEPEAKPAPAPEPAAANLTMEIEHLQMEASIRASVGDFTSAAQTYARLVEILPDVVEYRVRLAMAMARSPQMARQAEQQFQEAIRMDPENPELHFQLGLYYKGMRVHTRAIATFRQVLTLDPRHKKAQAELAAAASAKESPLDALKKLDSSLKKLLD
jgi:tetratricopeptide (TPR) repeat protein